MIIPQRKAQIALLEGIIKKGKCNNVFALQNKIIRLKLELILEENKASFQAFLAQ